MCVENAGVCVVGVTKENVINIESSISYARVHAGIRFSAHTRGVSVQKFQAIAKIRGETSRRDAEIGVQSKECGGVEANSDKD